MSHYLEKAEYLISIRVMKTNLIHYLSSIYLVNQLLHVSGISVAHHQEVHCISITRANCCIYIYIYSIPPDDGLQIYTEHVEVD